MIFISNTTQTISLDIPFLPYGPGINDTESRFNDSVRYYPLETTRIPIVFYRQEQVQLFVSDLYSFV